MTAEELVAHRHKLLDGRTIARSMAPAIAAEAKALAESGWAPKLVSISVGDGAATHLYVRNQKRTAESLGIAFEERTYPSTIGTEELTGVIHGLNADPRTSGIIIQRPVPA